MGLEQGGYQFKHPTHISLDSYQGIASGVMKLNDPVADEFMRVSDMRRNIVIVAKSQPRTYEYSELGFVKIGRMKLLDYASSESNGTLTINRVKDSWVFVVDDRAMWDQLPQSEPVSKREELFVDRFRDRVRSAAINCLVREKIFNGGTYSPAVLMSTMMSFATYSSIILGETASIMLDKHTLEVDVNSLIFLATGHLVSNTVNWVWAMIGRHREPLPGLPSPYPDYEEPFVRHPSLRNILDP